MVTLSFLVFYHIFDIDGRILLENGEMNILSLYFLSELKLES